MCASELRQRSSGVLYQPGDVEGERPPSHDASSSSSSSTSSTSSLSSNQLGDEASAVSSPSTARTQKRRKISDEKGEDDGEVDQEAEVTQLLESRQLLQASTASLRRQASLGGNGGCQDVLHSSIGEEEAAEMLKEVETTLEALNDGSKFVGKFRVHLRSPFHTSHQSSIFISTRSCSSCHLHL